MHVQWLLCLSVVLGIFAPAFSNPVVVCSLVSELRAGFPK